MYSLTPLPKEFFSITSLLIMVLASVFEEPVN
jgi:hypothetical protein